MKLKYNTLTEYTYRMQQYENLVKKQDTVAIKHFLSENTMFMQLRDKILSSGALDPAIPKTRKSIGEDLYYPATRNGVLFYPDDVKYIQTTIHTDNVYRLLPKDPCIAALSGDYIIEKMIVNYEYFLNNTTPPKSTRCALICTVSELMNFMISITPNFRQQIAFNRIFIERWFEKIR